MSGAGAMGIWRYGLWRYGLWRYGLWRHGHRLAGCYARGLLRCLLRVGCGLCRITLARQLGKHIFGHPKVEQRRLGDHRYRGSQGGQWWINREGRLRGLHRHHRRAQRAKASAHHRIRCRECASPHKAASAIGAERRFVWVLPTTVPTNQHQGLIRSRSLSARIRKPRRASPILLHLAQRNRDWPRGIETGPAESRQAPPESRQLLVLCLRRSAGHATPRP